MCRRKGRNVVLAPLAKVELVENVQREVNIFRILQLGQAPAKNRYLTAFYTEFYYFNRINY